MPYFDPAYFDPALFDTEPVLMAISAPLAPYARQWGFNLGLIVPGALLHTYVGGTVSTPLLTYSDAARTTPNANPVVASTAGLFGPLFLIPEQSYHMVLETAAGVVIWDQDNVNAPREGSFTTAAAGPIDNLAIPAGITLLRCDNASLLALSGMAAGFDGQRVQIVSVGTGNVQLYHNNGGSSVPNRFINLITSAGNAATLLMAGKGWAEYVYDGISQRWRMSSYEQGEWFSMPWSASNFTASGGGGWSVDAADQLTYSYYLRGRQVTVAWRVINSSVITVAPATLNLAIPNGLIARTSVAGPFAFASDNGAPGVASLVQVGAGESGMNLFPTMTATGTWTLGANATISQGIITFEVD